MCEYVPLHLCLTTAPARELLRSLAVTGANFLSTHARAADGTFAFCLSEEGAHVAAQRKMFSACF